jgi:hypothetical protein
MSKLQILCVVLPNVYFVDIWLQYGIASRITGIGKIKILFDFVQLGRLQEALER